MVSVPRTICPDAAVKVAFWRPQDLASGGHQAGWRRQWERPARLPRDTRRPLMTPAPLGEGREGRTGPRVTTTLSRAVRGRP